MMLGMSTQAIGPAAGEIPLDTWATRLVIARTQRGLTKEEAADKAGVNRSSWSNWENGTVPRGQLEVTRRIANALGYDLNWLLWGGPLASEHGGPEGPDGLPRLDSNQRDSDYMSDTQLIQLGQERENRRTSRSNRPRNPFRRKHSQEPQYPDLHPVAA